MNKIFNDRIERVRCDMINRGYDGLIICDPHSIRYLCNIWNEPYERMYVLYLDKDGKDKLFVNKLFNIPANDFEEFWFSDTDDYISILADNTCKDGTVGVDKVWTARFLIPLMEHNKQCHYVLGSDCVDDTRACKDSTEQDFMREASRINDVCIAKGMAYIKEGMSEKQVAKYIEEQFILEGASGPSFETIVSFGANAADPHHEPDDTVVKEGDCVLIDMGCIKNNYCSDMTRTNFFKSAPKEYADIHDICRQANEIAESIIKPGVPLCEIDKAARDHITKAGYGEYFTHRLGHFIGQTEHEKGDVSATNTQLAREGMIFSIEPGIYLPGKFGVRVEDLVLVTKDGCEILNKEAKNWHIVG